MRRLLLMSVAVLAVSGCARIIEGSTQRVTIETPGAEGAACFLQNEEYRYKLYAPQTITMTKTRKPLHVRCLAPGNRQKEIIVTPKIDEATFMNATNAFVGSWMDYESMAMYKLPDTIIVDFRDMKPSSMPAPTYDRFFRSHPELRGYEEFRPGLPALQRDIYDSPSALRRREIPGGESVLTDEPAAAPAEDTAASSSSGPSAPAYTGGGSADSLTRQMNPGVFNPASAPSSGDRNFVGGTATDDAAGYPLPLMR